MEKVPAVVTIGVGATVSVRLTASTPSVAVGVLAVPIAAFKLFATVLAPPLFMVVVVTWPVAPRRVICALAMFYTCS
jgi:hypothetical protein